MNPTSKPTPGAIAELAYRLWEQAGRPEGRAEEFWYNAELQLRPGPAAAAPTTAPDPTANNAPPQRRRGQRKANR